MLELLRAGALAALLATWADGDPPAAQTGIREPADIAVVRVAGGQVADMRMAHMRVAHMRMSDTRGADPWLGADKFQHFWMSYAATAFVFAGTRMAGAERDAALHIAVPVAALAGVVKEAYDMRSGGRFSVRDLVADGLGVAAAYFLLREVR